MRDNPNYYAILTADVRYDNRLTSSEKLFYAEITALSNKHGYCYASNSYFAELYDVKRSTISAWVKKLVDTGHIYVEMLRDGKAIIKRKIYVVKRSNTNAQGVVNKSNGVVNTDEGGGQSIGIGWSIYPKENNTSNNTTSMNIHNHAFAQFWELYGKKVDRKRAYQRWSKLRKSDIDLIMEFIPIYKKSVSDKQYMKNPDTFLNSRIWEDDWDEYKPKSNATYIQSYRPKPSRTELFIQRGQELIDSYED